VAPGFDDRSPISSALKVAGRNMVEGFATLLLILLSALPWVVVLLFLLWLFRRFGAPIRRFFNPVAVEPDRRPGE
jgi:hypothetical protein